MIAVLGVNTRDVSSVPLVKKVYIHPPTATRIVLPDGRHLAYHEQGVTADRARLSLIAPHSFLSSRLAGILPCMNVICLCCISFMFYSHTKFISHI